MSDNTVMGSFFRSPLGLFVATLAVGGILLAAGMTAFGGTSGRTAGSVPPPPKPLSPAQFNRAGEHICVSLRSQLVWLAHHKPKNLRQVTSYMSRATSIFDRLTADVDGIVPPPAAAASFRHLRANLGVADRALHRLNHLTETHQWRRVVLLVRSRWWKNIGERFGPPTKVKDIHCGWMRHPVV
jgi:hypothetical protein